MSVDRLRQIGVEDRNEDVMIYKGTDWKNMSVPEWFHFAKANAIFREPGISYEELLAMYDALMTFKRPIEILETGQCLGTTTRFFTIYTLKYGGNHTSCEIKRRDLFVKAMKDLGLEDKFTTLGDSMKTPWDKPIDLLFIDSEHCITDALGEYMRFRVFLKQNGVVGFHDTDTCYGVRRAIDIIKNEIDELELVSKADNSASAGIEFYRLKSHAGIAHKVNNDMRQKETERLIAARKAQVA